MKEALLDTQAADERGVRDFFKQARLEMENEAMPDMQARLERLTRTE